MTKEDCYRELEVAQNVSEKDVKDAYKDLMAIWHPDRQPERLKEKSNQKCQRINQAYQRILQQNFEEINDQQNYSRGSSKERVVSCASCSARLPTDHENYVLHQWHSFMNKIEFTHPKVFIAFREILDNSKSSAELLITLRKFN